MQQDVESWLKMNSVFTSATTVLHLEFCSKSVAKEDKSQTSCVVSHGVHNP